MRRLVALMAATLLVASSAAMAQGVTEPGGGPHAFGRFLIADESGPVGWVSLDVRPATPAHPDPGLFQFEALRGVVGYPVTTRAAITWTDFYHEAGCCGMPDSLSMGGHEVAYYADETSAWSDSHGFWAGFYDMTEPTSAGGFFRWQNTNSGGLTEFAIVGGRLTVILGQE